MKKYSDDTPLDTGPNADLKENAEARALQLSIELNKVINPLCVWHRFKS